MPAPLRIAVLECDTPLPNIHNRYNGYGGVFTELLKASAKALNKPDQLDPENGLDISKWDVVNAAEYPRLEDVDAVLLSGSSASLLICIPVQNHGELIKVIQQSTIPSMIRRGSNASSNSRNKSLLRTGSACSGYASAIRSLAAHSAQRSGAATKAGKFPSVKWT